MVSKRRKVVLWCAAGGLVVSVLLLLLYGLVSVFNAYNPMQLAFLASFEMYNASGTEVWVTPIGMYEGSGKYGPLERFSGPEAPAFASRDDHDIHLRIADSVAFTYDWDDINFRHILVRNSRGDVFVLDTDKMGTLEVCYGPQHETYTIPPLSKLHRAPPALVPCTRGRTVRWTVVEHK